MNYTKFNHEITAYELKRLLPESPLIINVGANDGSTMEEILDVLPGASIIAFEPDPRPLKRWRLKSCRNASVYPIAISDRHGTFEFYQSGGSIPRSTAPCKNDWDYSGSLHVPTGHLDRDKAVKFPTIIEVETAPLDAFFPFFKNPDMIYADVQGSEARLILGAQKTLSVTKWLYSEFGDVEQYHRQPDLRGLLSFLPDWDLVATYADNALLKNRTIETL